MATYATLRDRALGRVGGSGQTDLQTVAQTALEEAMKYVAYRVRIKSLIASATYTIVDTGSLEADAPTIAEFTPDISTAFQMVDRLYVKPASQTDGYGTPYNFYEYHHFLDLRESPGTERIGVFSLGNSDERDTNSFTLTPANKIWANYVSNGSIMTLFYRKSPAAYGDGSGTPEIDPMFDFILVNGAEIALKEYLREPAEITTLWSLFDQGLKADCDKYDEFLNASRRRDHLKIHKSYRPC